FPIGSDNYAGALDDLANIRLAQDRTNECEQLLNQIEAISQDVQSTVRYPYRHAALTRTRLLTRQGHIERALASAEYALELAKEVSDQLLVHTVTLRKAEILVKLERIPEALEALDSVAASVPTQPPDVVGLYE